MAYAEGQWKNKKALKEAVKEGRQIGVYSPGPFPVTQNGRVGLEGPSYRPHTWYANAEVVNGIIVKVS